MKNLTERGFEPWPLRRRVRMCRLLKGHSLMVGESACEATPIERAGAAQKPQNYQKKLRVCQVKGHEIRITGSPDSC